MSFDIVMSIYELRHIITANIDNFYSLLYVDKNQLSFVKEYIHIKSSALENPNEFILYEYITRPYIDHHVVHDIDERILFYDLSNTFRKILISDLEIGVSFAFTIASFNNNYEIMKYLLDLNETECDIQHVIHNKQYDILQYIMDTTDLWCSVTFHKDILIPIILMDDIIAFNICKECYIEHIRYYIDITRRANKKEILKVIEELDL